MSLGSLSNAKRRSHLSSWSACSSFIPKFHHLPSQRIWVIAEGSIANREILDFVSCFSVPEALADYFGEVPVYEIVSPVVAQCVVGKVATWI